MSKFPQSSQAKSAQAKILYSSLVGSWTCPSDFVVMYIGDSFAAGITDCGGGGGGRETHHKISFIVSRWLWISFSWLFNLFSICPLWFLRNSIFVSCCFSTFNMVSLCLQQPPLGQGIMAHTLYIKLTNAWMAWIKMNPVDGGESQTIHIDNTLYQRDTNSNS